MFSGRNQSIQQDKYPIKSLDHFFLIIINFYYNSTDVLIPENRDKTQRS